MQEPWWSKLIFVLVGAIVSGAGAYMLWHFQERDHKETLARALLTEVSSNETNIQLYANAFQQGGPGRGTVTIEQPFYSAELYERAGKDVFALEPETAQLLFDFYTALRTAERDRTVEPTDQFFSHANDEMKRCILKANAIIPELKVALREEAGQ